MDKIKEDDFLKLYLARIRALDFSHLDSLKPSMSRWTRTNGGPHVKKNFDHLDVHL